MGRGEEEVPIVARPPNFIRPNLRNGTESVVTPGTISRITVVSSGVVEVLVAIVLAVMRRGIVVLLFVYREVVEWRLNVTLMSRWDVVRAWWSDVTTFCSSSSVMTCRVIDKVSAGPNGDFQGCVGGLEHCAYESFNILHARRYGTMLMNDENGQKKNIEAVVK